MKQFIKRQLIVGLGSLGLIAATSQVMAGAFQLWEQDGASLGNYHAGYAATANDASTAFYNPAGIMRIKNQQAVFGGVVIATDFKYNGSVRVIESPAGFPLTSTFSNVTTQGGNISFLPALHYVAPLSDRMGFGLSVVVPFGLKTDYGTDTPLRYAATRTAISVVDVAPVLAFQVTDKGSIGAGLDIQKVWAEFNSVGTAVDPNPVRMMRSDTISKNEATGTGYGYHLGGLYEFTPDTRVGISYHSQVVHHLSGTSKFVGRLADQLNHGYPISSNHATVRITLPAYTALSVYHRLHPKVAFLGSAIYTQWSVFKTLILNDVAGAVSDPNTLVAGSNTIQVTIPQYFHNTWNVSVGTEYYPTEDIILRGGLGYDQSPVVKAYRNVQLPDNDRYIVAVGGHYQATKTIGFDVGYAHLFIREASISPPPQVMGAQTVVTNGSVRGGADVYSGQVTWDIT